MKYYTYETNLSDRNKIISSVETTFGNRRYFSSLDTEVYFGTKQIDEMVAIDFTISEPKLPIYGYNSFFPNRIVAGRRTVQGTFAINFTSPKYLLDILNSIEDSVLANDYEALVYNCPEPDSTGLGIGNSAIFKKMFDITISYGYGKSENPSYRGCYQTIVGVQIVDYRQALDTEGNPILDMYSFIAKDIRYESAATDGTTTAPPDDTTKTPTTPQAGSGETPETPKKSGFRVANKDHKDGMSELLTACKNTDVEGFIVTTYLYKTIDDLYFLRFGIETTHNATEKFENVSVVIVDNDLGVNFSFAIDGLSPNTTKDVALTGDYRKDIAKIFKQIDKFDYVEGLGYQTQSDCCAVEFVALVDGAKTTVELPTFVTILEKRQNKN